ncbi:lipid II flippase MurJ [Halobacteriovorax sp. ZH1_bin.1]|uniref:lipid II flippase MurJ n=1 Tax=Halobacteriovorax sp. ZH1_bin.1 TaxID=3157723 RepID=UPI0037141B39
MSTNTNNINKITSYIVILNLIGFALLFLRDLYLTKVFGFTDNLDLLFQCLIIPMFIVNSFNQSTNNIISIELNGKQLKSDELFNKVLSLNLTFELIKTVLVATLFYVLKSFYLPLLFPKANLLLLNNLFDLALTLVVLSPFLTILNTVLNIENRSLWSTGASLIVPIASFLSLVFLRDSLGTYAYVVGLIVAQVLNCILLFFFNYQRLKRFQFVSTTFDELKPHLFKYLNLTLTGAALFLMFPLDQLMSDGVSAGGVSYITFSLKIGTVFVALMTNVLNSVILPYLVNNDKEFDVKFLHSLFFITLLVLLCYELSGLYFLNLVFDNDASSNLFNFIYLALSQLPLIILFLYIQKYFIAKKFLIQSLIISGIVILSNFILNRYFLSILGLSGILWATLSAFFIGSLLVVCYLFYEKKYNKLNFIVFNLYSLLLFSFLVYRLEIL